MFIVKIFENLKINRVVLLLNCYLFVCLTYNKFFKKNGNEREEENWIKLTRKKMNVINAGMNESKE